MSTPRVVFSASRLFALASALILTVVPVDPLSAQVYDESGGDDVLVATDAGFRGDPPTIDIAENGDIYVAVSAIPVGGAPEIRVYRSQDAGDSFQLWGTIFLAVAPAQAMDFPSIHIGEGTQDLVYVAFRYRGPSDANYSIVVATAPLGAPSGHWALYPAMAAPGVDFQSPSIHSDEMSNTSYRVYLAAMGSGLDGGDVWFSRSTSFGSSWESPYQVFSSTAGDGYFYPEVRYGRGGYVHCVCYFRPITSTGLDYAVLYRRTGNYAVLGQIGWDSAVELTSSADGDDEFHASVAAAHDRDRVMIGYAHRDTADQFQPAVYRWSTDGGATWPAGNTTTTADNELPHLMANDARQSFYGWGNVSTTDNFGTGAIGYAATDWSPNLSLMDRTYAGILNTHPGGRYCDANAAKQGRAGYVWMTWNSAGPDSVFFDAEWRTDPGYPNVESGFPVLVGVQLGCEAPPALCELDGDPESEILFGTGDGNIRAYNHDGTVVPGWPIDIGEFGRHATVAAGNIAGDAANEVVAANSSGWVHAFNADGSPLPGWPVNLGGASSAYVALGLISGPRRQVVATNYDKIFLLNGDGTPAAGFPVTLPEFVRYGPAVGDVDNDGHWDIVVNTVHGTRAYSRTGSLIYSRSFGSAKQTFSGPVLGDLDPDLDGDLETVVTTYQGDVYVLDSDGTDEAGWPWHDPDGEDLTGAALADVTGAGLPEIVVGVAGSIAPEVHVLSASGSELPGWPRSQPAGNVETATPIVDVLGQSATPSVTRGSHLGMGYAWDALAADLPGWPRPLPTLWNQNTSCLVSAASGDVDGDGNVEVLFVTSYYCTLVLFDMGRPVDRNPVTPRHWWPMFGYNAMRQSCLACGPDAVTGVIGDAAQPGIVRLAPPAPNPSRGPVHLRFDLAQAAAVRLDVFDSSGRRVRRLLKAELPDGPHEAIWDGTTGNGSAAPEGVYYLRLAVNGEATEARKVVLAR